MSCKLSENKIQTIVISVVMHVMLFHINLNLASRRFSTNLVKFSGPFWNIPSTTLCLIVKNQFHPLHRPIQELIWSKTKYLTGENNAATRSHFDTMSFQTFVGNIFGDTEPRVWLVFIVSVKEIECRTYQGLSFPKIKNLAVSIIMSTHLNH